MIGTFRVTNCVFLELFSLSRPSNFMYKFRVFTETEIYVFLIAQMTIWSAICRFACFVVSSGPIKWEEIMHRNCTLWTAFSHAQHEHMPRTMRVMFNNSTAITVKPSKLLPFLVELLNVHTFPNLLRIHWNIVVPPVFDFLTMQLSITYQAEYCFHPVFTTWYKLKKGMSQQLFNRHGIHNYP